MKFGRRKMTFLSNLALIVAFTAVFAISFFPQQSVPIYGGKNLSALYFGDKSGNKVSLMFNVYEDAETVEKIVDTLDEYGAKATFFVGGCWADDNGKTLEKIAASGHEIANHGYFHKDHATLDYQKNREEIYLTGVIVKALCGITPTLFAPPSGSYSEKTLQAADDLGYKVIMWTKDTIDWRDKDEGKIIKRATDGLSGGDLILMHPKKHTLAALPTVLEYCTQNGFSLVSVSENISPENAHTT